MAGITWLSLEVEVVAGAVQVHRQQVDGVHAVLVAVGLGLDQQQLLGQPVGGVGLLRVAVPQGGLAERHRGVLGVGADRARDHHLGDPGDPAGLQQLDAHERVLVEEPARLVPVGADPADHRGQVHDRVGAGVGQHPVDLGPPAQVVAGPAEGEHLGAVALQLGGDVAAEEAGAPGHDDGGAGDPHAVDPHRAAGQLVVEQGDVGVDHQPDQLRRSRSGAASPGRRAPWRRRRRGGRPRRAGSSGRRSGRGARQSRPAWSKAASQNSRTVWLSPVAIT